MKFLLILAVAPGAFLVYMVYKQDKIEKEPPALLRKLLLAGAISVFPAIILEMIGEALLNLVFGGPGSQLYFILEAFIMTALVEEVVKYIPLKKLTWLNPAFDYTFDGIVYSICTGMGFAILENIFYVLGNGVGNGLMRAVTSIPGHAVFAIYMGYYYGMARQSDSHIDDKDSKKYLKKALWVPTFLHGFYDYCLMSGLTILILVFFIFIIALFIITFKKIKKYSVSDTAIVDEDIDVEQSEQA